MAQYDPAVMQKLVDKLQARAMAALIYYPVMGAALGGLGMFYAYRLNAAEAGGLIWGGVIMGGLIGLSIGQHRSLALKAQAQALLCQMKIEENTRK
jgi:hypothetical protein